MKYTHNYMKIFLDTSDTELIHKYHRTGLIDGITTNPTLIMKSGRNPEDVYQEIKDIGIKDISMEVVGDEGQMYCEGKRLYEKFGDVCTVKVPCTREGLAVCKSLSDQNIRVNVTLIFTAPQAVLAAKAGATYVSPFVGRVYDNSFDGIKLIEEIADVFATHGRDTKVLAASVREVQQVSSAFRVGADICTLPIPVFNKMYNHVLTDKGLELFDKDWQELQTCLTTT